MGRQGMYASGRTFGRERAGDLRAKINEQVAQVSKLGAAVSYEQALSIKERDERRDRFFAKLSRKASKVQEALRVEWTDQPDLKTVPVFVTREMFFYIAKFVEFAPVEATKKQVDEIFDSLDDKFGKHPERLNTQDLLKLARASALAKMVKTSSRQEVAVNSLMYRWEEGWREKNEKHVERHAMEVVYMKTAQDRARREFINVMHNTELRKIRQAHARTRRLERELNLPHTLGRRGGRGRGEASWGAVGHPTAQSHASEGFDGSRGPMLDSQQVMDLRQENDYGDDAIFVPRMTNMTLAPPERHAHDRYAASLAASLSAPVLPAAMLPATASVGGRVRTPSHAPPDPRSTSPIDWKRSVDEVLRLSTPAVPRHRQLPTAHSDVSWSAQRVASGELGLTMGTRAKRRERLAARAAAATTISSGSVATGSSVALEAIGGSISPAGRGNLRGNLAESRRVEELQDAHRRLQAPMDDWGSPGQRAAIS